LAAVIDLHCHLLPGIDDGPRDMAEAVALATEAARDGVRVVAATPHARDDHPGVHVDELAQRCRQVALALPADVELEIVPGAELDLLWAQRASDEELRLASYGGRGTDLLIETPYGELPLSFEDLLFALTVRGFRLLLAHPERSPAFQDDRGRLRRLAERGVLLQVTAPGLIAPRRSPHGRLARWLVQEGVAQVIASDAHSAASIRPPLLGAAVARAAALDPVRARWMVEDAPAAILAGEPLPEPPPQRVGRLLRWRR
jgi:protein-tyrosine phosphatase